MFRFLGIIGGKILQYNVFVMSYCKKSNIFKPIIIYSAAAGGGGGGAMAAAMVSHFRYMSMFNTVLVSSIVDKYARSYGHKRKSTQKSPKTRGQHRS